MSRLHVVHLMQLRPGQYAGRADGHAVEALLLGGVWVVFVDGVEQFSAARLAVAEDKLEQWLADRT